MNAQPPAFIEPQGKEELSKALRLSAGAHATLIIIALLSSLIFHHEPVVISPSIRVDLVGLPDIKKKDLANATPDLETVKEKLDKVMEKPVEREAPAPKEKPDFSLKKKKKTDNLQDAINRIKALEEIESQVNKKPAKRATVAQIKGNAVSKGNALTGNSTQDINAYAAGMQGKLRQNWDLPVWLAQQKLSARVVVFLDKQGYVTNTVIAQSSGNKQYDEYTLKTVRMSQPFGPPPQDILDDGVLLLFPL